MWCKVASLTGIKRTNKEMSYELPPFNLFNICEPIIKLVINDNYGGSNIRFYHFSIYGH